jgi:osmoprotectant transport system substrate-binding protein
VSTLARMLAVTALAAVALVVGGCGSSTSGTTESSNATTQTTLPPGSGRPTVTIGDKNFTEQFVLGELYYEALKAQGFSVLLNRNIGPTEVTMQALQSGQLAMYPEYLDTWNSAIAGNPRASRTLRSAYGAGQAYATAHNLELLEPTPFSDTDAIGVTLDYAVQNSLSTIRDLRKVAQTLTFGAPPQFQTQANGLPALEQEYGFVPAAFKTLEIGGQYQALDQGAVQAADVNTTDGQLTTGNYVLLKDPLDVLGHGNVVPVVSAKAIQAEGPAFAATINRVSSLLTLQAIRQLNAAVDIYNEDPAAVAQQFLAAHGLAAAAGTS